MTRLRFPSDHPCVSQDEAGNYHVDLPQFISIIMAKAYGGTPDVYLEDAKEINRKLLANNTINRLEAEDLAAELAIWQASDRNTGPQ